MKLLRLLSVFTLANLVNKGIGFFLLPVFTYTLSRAEMGQFELLLSCYLILSPFVSLGGNTAVNIEYFKKEEDEAYGRYVFSAWANAATAAAFWFALLVPFREALGAWLGVSPGWLLALPLMCLLGTLPQFVLVVYHASQRSVNYACYSVGNTAFDMGLSVMLLVWAGTGYASRLWGILAAGAIMTLVGILILRKENHFQFKYDREAGKRALVFGLPLILHMLGHLAINHSDRLFIAKMAGLDELGVYSVGYRVGSLAMVVCNSLAVAWQPILFDRLKRINENDRSKRQAETLVVWQTLAIALGFFALPFALWAGAHLLAMELPFLGKPLIDPAYEGWQVYVFWVALGYSFLGIYTMMVQYLYFHNRTGWLGGLAVLNVVLNLVLNYWLVGLYGALGAAYATAVSFAIFAGLVFVLAQRLQPMPWGQALLRFDELLRPN